MPVSLSTTLLPLAAAAALFAPLFLAGAGPAAAFSQIGSEDGSDTTRKEGIIAVPLPPLESQQADEDDAGAPPPSSPATTPPATMPTGAPVTPPTAPLEAPGTTDDGEGEDAPEPDASEPLGIDGVIRSNEDVPPAGSGTAVPPPSTPPGAADDAPPAAPIAPPASGDRPVVPSAEVFHGEDGLPATVRDLRRRLIEIAEAGEIEALRPYIEVGEDPTLLTFGGIEGDPIDHLKSASGDGEGVEILAILLEVLESGHIRSEPASDNEIFIWPYFTGVPIDTLTNPQKVELFELVTAGDYQEMLGFGAYNFYRAGISPDGRLEFFVAGD